MKGAVGTRTSIYHNRLPHQRKIMRIAKTLNLSKVAVPGELFAELLTRIRQLATVPT